MSNNNLYFNNLDENKNNEIIKEYPIFNNEYFKNNEKLCLQFILNCLFNDLKSLDKFVEMPTKLNPILDTEDKEFMSKELQNSNINKIKDMIVKFYQFRETKLNSNSSYANYLEKITHNVDNKEIPKLYNSICISNSEILKNEYLISKKDSSYNLDYNQNIIKKETEFDFLGNNYYKLMMYDTIQHKIYSKLEETKKKLNVLNGEIPVKIPLKNIKDLFKEYRQKVTSRKTKKLN